MRMVVWHGLDDDDDIMYVGKCLKLFLFLTSSRENDEMMVTDPMKKE